MALAKARKSIEPVLKDALLMATERADRTAQVFCVLAIDGRIAGDEGRRYWFATVSAPALVGHADALVRLPKHERPKSLTHVATITRPEMAR